MHRLTGIVTNHPGRLLAVAAIIFLLLGAGQDGINLDSSTYAVIARNMVEHGTWFNPAYTPYYHPHFAEHPPLVMWGQAVVFALLGANDTTARIFGALCTLGAIVLAYRLGRTIRDRAFGFLSGLVLLLTYNFMQQGNSTLLDVPMSFFILLALWGMARLETGQTRGVVFLLCGLGLSGAFLAKGVVAAPVWLAIAGTILLRRRRWLARGAFWWLPAAALLPIAVYLMLDQIYANGHFLHHYFAVQVWSRFLGGGPEIDTRWWEFTWRFVKLYLPWIILLPFGAYYAVKRRLNLLLPLALSLLLYFVFYSSAAKLYYHYFCPAYALAAPLAALPLSVWLSQKAVRFIGIGFAAVWIVAAAAVTATGVRIHHIRAPHMYALTGEMHRLLESKPGREGLIIGTSNPNWEYIAKASWYWRSDLCQANSWEAADDLLRTDGRYAYILAEKKQLPAVEKQVPDNLAVAAETGELVVLTAK